MAKSGGCPTRRAKLHARVLGVSSHSTGGLEQDRLKLVLPYAISRRVLAMEDYQEITDWIEGIKQGDPRAEEFIWQEYFDKLVRFARQKLESMPRRAADEEDVALSAMDSFLQGAASGRFPRLNDRDDLWKLLVTITARKATAQHKKYRTKKRGSGRIRGESAFVGQHDIGDVLGHEPTPELAMMFVENCEVLIEQLAEEPLKQVAFLKMNGYLNEEVAQRLDCTTRTIERRLGRIREIWSSTILESRDV